METSDLIGQLRKRIEETVRDRDRLADAIIDLGHTIKQLEEEENTVTRLVAKFTGTSVTGPTSDETSNERPLSLEMQSHDTSLRWPVGPGYTKPIKVKKIQSWARYKFDSADWYLNTLREICSHDQKLKRTIGVEMAVDGVIQSLSATYDAAMFALTSAVERAANVPKERRTPLHLVSWSKLAAEAKFFGIDLASSLSVSDGLIGEHLEEPEGWLAQLLVLQRRSKLQDVLVVNKHEKSGSNVLSIEVPGRGVQPLLAYLSDLRNLVGELLETIMHDITDARKGRLFVSEIDQLRGRAEGDLADLLTMKRVSDS